MNQKIYENFISDLETGKIRVAHKIKEEVWQLNIDAKQKILEIFKNSPVVDMGEELHPQYYGFPDKNLLKPRFFTPQSGVRMVPGGSSVRAGSYIGKNVVIMPPSYINIGAYIDDETMIDSHVLVGSCAQIGKRVHLSAGVQIGGILEPIGNLPTIIEDNSFIGAGVVLTEGILVQEGAVIASGVSISKAMPIYDIVKEKIYKRKIPPYAVVIPGTRPLLHSKWSKDESLALNCAVIVKYRDQKTNRSVKLEKALRENH